MHIKFYLSTSLDATLSPSICERFYWLQKLILLLLGLQGKQTEDGK